MDTKELRIGNLIEFNNHIEEVALIDHNSITCYRENQGRCVPSAAIDPIKLTEEWIFKLGFNGNGEKLGCNLYRIRRIGVYKMIGNYPFFVDGAIDDIKVDYVHQLQNLYHSLTGKELEIKG